MKKRSLFKRIAAIAMSAAMVLGMTTAASAETSTPTFDPNITAGSLTIQKFKTDTNEPIDDVTFKYVKVGEFDVTKPTADNKTYVNGFKLTDSDLASALELNTTDVYDGGKIQTLFDAYALKNKDAITEKMKEDTTISSITTVDGKAKAEQLPLGLYMVVETEAPDEVTSMHVPFLVSVPTLETLTVGDQDEQEWQYEVVVKPKNDYINQPPVPEKEVVDGNGGEGTNNSANIGDTLTFEIKSTVPNMAGTLEKFVFTDTMSEGLAYDKEQVLTVEGKTTAEGKWSSMDASLYEASFDDTTNTLTVTFKDADTNIKNKYHSIRVLYKATLTEDAIVGKDGNTNKFIVDYSNNPDVEKPQTEIKVDTYGFNLQKTDADSKLLAGAVFELYDAATGGNKVSFYTQLDDDNTVTTKPDQEKNFVTSVTTDKDGKANFYGLEAGTYYLQETKAPEILDADGKATGKYYNLLKERIQVVVSADTSTDTIDITVVNTKGFDLPETGGMGTIIFTVGGIAIMLGAALLLIRANKKSKAN